MKRVKSGCIAQTLLFAQKPDSLLPREAALMMNRQEVIRYKNSMDRTHTKYAVIDETVQQDGSILIHIKKQINATTDTSEYFD